MSDFATYPRTCRVNGVTARHILNIIAKELKKNEVPIDEQMMVFQLVTDSEKRIVGALALDVAQNEFVFYQTSSVILACGGAHFLYTYGVGTPDMTGDGYAMAYQQGIPLVNMEFVQIGPGVINPPVTLLSGPVWKTHPILSNQKGERFLERNLPPGVDVKDVNNQKAFPFTVSNHSFYLDTLIQRESEANPSPNGGVWCEMAPGSEAIVEQKMPKTKRVLKSKGIDVHSDKFEVGLVAQCMNGGAQITTPDGETDIKGLFISGETAGGLRGPDRPGGNSLAEGQVFGYRTGKAAAHYSLMHGKELSSKGFYIQEFHSIKKWIENSQNGTKDVLDSIRELRRNMYQNCLVIRNESRLKDAWDYLMQTEQDLQQGNYALRLDNIKSALELRNMIITAKSIVLAALLRTESRSCHYREDFPEKNDTKWKRSIRIRKEDGIMIAEEYEWPAEQSTIGAK